MDPNLPAAGMNLVSSQSGWVIGYTAKDTGKVSPHHFYASGGEIIVYPYVCGGSLKTSPRDPGQRIQSNDDRARAFFPNPTLSEIRQYIGDGGCSDCSGRGDMDGNC